MSSDLQKLMRAVNVLAKRCWKYEQKDVAAALLKYCSQRERQDVPLVGQFLLDVWELYRSEAEPRCCQCGEVIYNVKDRLARADARYCSQRCRQRAYRQRVTAISSNGSRTRHTGPVRDASQDALGG